MDLHTDTWPKEGTTNNKEEIAGRYLRGCGWILECIQGWTPGPKSEKRMSNGKSWMDSPIDSRMNSWAEWRSETAKLQIPGKIAERFASANGNSKFVTSTYPLSFSDCKLAISIENSQFADS
jgi:hypothetical protein